MEWIKSKGKLEELFQKYKYVALIVLVGIVLMLLPMGGSKKETPVQIQADEAPAEPDRAQQLQQILQQIQGAGRVEVLLMEEAGEQILYQTNDDTSSDSGGQAVRTDTVLLTDADRNQSALVTQIKAPVYKGAVIVCQGADAPSVKLAIIDAVSKATGLSSDKISVLKMK